MFDALQVAAVGLQAQKERLDTLANNLANVSTTAFKRQTVDFASILDRAPRATRGEPVATPEARESRVLRVDAAQGDVRETGRALDIAIVGPGFLEVELPGHRTGYSRTGALKIDANGDLVLASGHVLKADIRAPSDASSIEVLADGRVMALIADDTTPTLLGRIELAVFRNAEALKYRGEGIFTAPDDVDPTRIVPGEDGAAPLAVRSLEGSNVRMTDELVTLMLVQRVYELNSRVFQTADELMSMTNNLRRG